MFAVRGVPGAALALFATSFVLSSASLAPHAYASSKLYDMNQMMGQENPLDVQRVPQPAATPAEAPQAAQPAKDGQFGGQLYDMSSMLNQPNPFDTASAQAPASGRTAGGQIIQASAVSEQRPEEVAQTPPPAPAPINAVSGAKSDADPAMPNLDEEYDPGQMGGDLDGRDPLETVNRAIFGFNEFVYQYLMTPAARAYNKAVPELARDSLSHTISNLNGPVTLANDVLQGEVKRAGNTLARFVINSTLGFFGTQDPASELGFPKHSEDFGQTLGAWGVGEGFYVVLPLLGPSNPRDAVGKLLVDGYFDPMGYYLDNTDNENWGYVRSGVSGFDEYAGIVDDLDNLRQTSVDFYGALRSLYRQRREAEIKNQEQGAVPSLGGR
jgi:phospholipid-binding lipoprotein MlaA